MYVEILHCRMWEAERKQIKYLYLAAAIIPATLTLVIISVRLGVWGKGGPVGAQLAPHVVHFKGQVDEPSILVIAEHLLE